MTTQRRGGLRRATARFRVTTGHLWAALALGAVSTLVLPAAPIAALPPGGASNDTEGTSASVSPSTLRAGQTISFRISGFPAGETVSVKIDDGDFCSEKGIHGACVVHQQKVGAGGKVQGSFALPEDLGAGKHWLRFLASAEVLDSEGRYVGVKPYSLRGGANFTVVAATTRQKSAEPRSSSAPTTATAPSAQRPESEAAQSDETPAATASAADSEGQDEPKADATSPAGASGTVAAKVLTVPVPPGSADAEPPAVAAVDNSSDDLDVAAADEGDGFPWIGSIVLALAVVLSGAWVLRSRIRV